MEKKPKEKRYIAAGERLKQARGSRTQEDARKAIDLAHVQAVQNWESGANRADPKHWAKIKEFYGINPAELYSGVAPPAPADYVEKDRIWILLSDLRLALEKLEQIVQRDERRPKGKAPRVSKSASNAQTEKKRRMSGNS